MYVCVYVCMYVCMYVTTCFSGAAGGGGDRGGGLLYTKLGDSTFMIFPAPPRVRPPQPSASTDALHQH